MRKPDELPSLPASQTLLAAALAGLLGVTVACEDPASSQPSGSAGSQQSAGAAGAGDAGAGGESAGGQGGAGDAGSAGAAGSGVTLSKIDMEMTAEKFKALCDEKGGTLEIHPHCGGANSCKGFSYDETTHTFTEHTCKGLNTCTGYSCVLP